MIRVLLIDDDPLIRVSLRRAIAAQPDMAVAGEAADGAAAVELIVGTAADVVVMDVNMPELSGIEVAQRIRTLGITVPVLFFTGDSQAVPAVTGSRVMLKASAGIAETLAAVRQTARGRKRQRSSRSAAST